MEPFSLVTGVASTVQICFKVGLQLKSFRDGMKIVDKRIEGILQDVNSLHNVLEAMQGTIKSSESKGSLHGTGHIGYHWSNLSQAVKDGSDILSELQELLEGTNKEVSVLDEARRELRYRLAVDQITMFRQRARSARDVLQLSLHSIIL
jgi:hypothetical protein